jgi:hypothetical protein
MLFDTDRGNIISPRALAAIGVNPREASAPRSWARTSRKSESRASTASSWGRGHRRHVFTTIDVADFMSRVDGVDNVVGIIGYELLKRFPIKLDFQRSRAVFYDPSRFTYAGRAWAFR